MRPPRALMICVFVGIFVVRVHVVFGVQEVAEESTDTTTQPFVPQPDGIDVDELATFLDQMVPQHLKDRHVPGAVVVVVEDGTVVFAKGFGLADIEAKRHVSPDQSLFHVASISKLFTATAVMQLAERGSINMDDDIQGYLKPFQLKCRYGRSVTFAHLLTHTSGFDDTAFGDSASVHTDLMSLEQYLSTRMPPQAFPPGTLKCYTNHGFALAGFLVEKISGIPFEQFIAVNILKPLRMDHSSFAQPLPLNLQADCALGYDYDDGNFVEIPVNYSNVAPAVALKATGADIARFMVAHLQEGRFKGTRILREETARDMHETHFSHHPRLPGMAYGFQERIHGSHRLLAHSGTSSLGFATELVLIPDENVGCFVAVNRRSAGADQIVGQFLDRYFPVKKRVPAAPKLIDDTTPLQEYSGKYRFIEYTRYTFEKLKAFSYGDQTVSYDQTTGLCLDGRPLRQIEPLLFQGPNGGFVAFRKDADGRITHLFIKQNAFEKLAWYDSIFVHIVLSQFCMFVFAGTSIGWTIDWFQYLRSKQQSIVPRLAKVARLLAWLICTSSFLTGVILGVVSMMMLATPTIMDALVTVATVNALLTIGLPIFAILVWWKRYWNFWGRLHFFAITGAAIANIPFLIYWNLLALGP